MIATVASAEMDLPRMIRLILFRPDPVGHGLIAQRSPRESADGAPDGRMIGLKDPENDYNARHRYDWHNR